jgi:hydroxypyruvate isomerase
MSLELAVCAEMVFLDRPFVDRVRAIAELGFAVELWSWLDKDIDALVATGARFSSMTGYVHGSLLDPALAETLLETAEQTVPVAARLGCPRLVVHPAELVDGRAARPAYRSTGQMWLTAVRTLTRLAELGERAGVTFCLENLNTAVDHPGVPLARAKDTLALVEAVGSRHVRLMLDLYHAQIGEGNLIALLERAAPALGEVQVADVPGRCEPGTGEINYPAVAAALRRTGYSGTVGLEAWAAHEPTAALAAFRAAFAEPGGSGR